MYGTLVNTGDNSYDGGNIVFNLDDVVRVPKGELINSYVQAVSFNFSLAPHGPTPKLWLYVLSPVVTGVNIYFYLVRNRMYQIPYSRIATDFIGIQTIILPVNMLPISPGQFLGVGFDEGGGTCYQVEHRTQYSCLPSDFSSVFKEKYDSHDWGISFSFVVHTTATTIL